MGLLKNIVLTLGKGVIGFTANSQALVADAMHSLTDIMADLVAMATLRIARLPADREHPYGHGKYEPIGALCISSLLVSAGISLAWTSVGIVQDMLSSNVALAVPGIAALWLSLVAIALNEALFRSVPLCLVDHSIYTRIHVYAHTCIHSTYMQTFMQTYINTHY